MYIQNRRDSSKFRACSLLQNCNGLISLKPEIAYFAYTKRWRSLGDHRIFTLRSTNKQLSLRARIYKLAERAYESQVYSNSKSVYKVAKLIGVSSFALIVKALNLSLISLDHYHILKEQVQKDFNEFLIREEDFQFLREVGIRFSSRIEK